MNEQAGITLKWPQWLLVGAALVASGAGGMYFLRQPPDAAPAMPPPSAPSPGNPSRAPAGGSPPAPSTSESRVRDVTVTLSADATRRAGIEIAPIGTDGASPAIGGAHVPGMVQPNAYRTVRVTPLAAGRVTRVIAELGQHVTRGQTLAEIYSPEVSEAATRFVSARAALDAHDRMVQRTEKLVEIGAASRQELEQVHAEHTAAIAAVESARSRLQLLGLTPDRIASVDSSAAAAILEVPSPIAGVVTERQANAGANVDTATPLLTIVDLSTVWVVGNVYEKDFARVRVGSPVTITATAHPDLRLDTRITYVDPQLNLATRTAQVRADVPNRNGALKLGEYADMSLGPASASTAIVIPRRAVQMVGDRAVVYVAGGDGTFIEREVTLGEPRGDQVSVVSGVHAGDRIVTTGSFAVRAELERLGLRSPARAAASDAAPR